MEADAEHEISCVGSILASCAVSTLSNKNLAVCAVRSWVAGTQLCHDTVPGPNEIVRCYLIQMLMVKILNLLVYPNRSVNRITG